MQGGSGVLWLMQGKSGVPQLTQGRSGVHLHGLSGPHIIIAHLKGLPKPCGRERAGARLGEEGNSPMDDVI